MRKLFVLAVFSPYLLFFDAAAAEKSFAAEKSSTAEAGKVSVNVKEILTKVDKLYRADNSYARVEMKIVNPDWERTMLMDVWSLGLNKTFIRILSPAKDKDVATLRIGRDMWNYFPKIDKVMRIPPSMMMGSWMGSHFNNDDLVKGSRLSDDYNLKITFQGRRDSEDIIEITLTPKPNAPVVWGRIIATARTSDWQPLKNS